MRIFKPWKARSRLPGTCSKLLYKSTCFFNQQIFNYCSSFSIQWLKCTTKYFSSSQLFYLSHVNQCFQVNGEELAADDKTIHQGRIKLNEIKTACAAIKRKKESLMVTIIAISCVPIEYTFLPLPTKSNCLLYASRYWKGF